MKKIILIAFAILLYSCNKVDSNNNLSNSNLESNDSTILNYTIICQNNLFGNGKEGFKNESLIIKDDSNWNKLIQQIDSYNLTSEKFIEKSIDFNNYIIIALFDEIRFNSGHSIDIKTIIEKNKTIVVNIYKKNNGDISSVITQPFYIIKIPKKSKEILFNL